MSAGPFVQQMPVQATPTDPARKSTAPYNFVPLPERVVLAATSAEPLPRHDRFAPVDYPHCGWFDVTLTTETPLYIRAPLQRDVFANQVTDAPDYRNLTKNIPDFFHRGERAQPVIPGHSLRGMLRGLIEMVGYGKVTQILDRALVYRAVGDTSSLGAWYRQQTLGDNKSDLPQMRFNYPSPQLCGGFLRQNPAGGWQIEPGRCDAVTHGETLVHVEHTELRQVIKTELSQVTPVPVFATPVARTAPNRNTPNLTLDVAITNDLRIRRPGDPTPPGMLPAWLVESGWMPNKHMDCAIYEPDPNPALPPELIEIPEILWQQYVEDRDLHRGPNTPTRPLRNDGDPLFYLVDDLGELIFFGPCQMFRLPYTRAPKELVPAAPRRPLDIDFADALFGYVRTEKDFSEAGVQRKKQGDPAWAFAGRVRVTDAMLAADQDSSTVFLGPLTPHILSTPKPTSFQHYLVQGADPAAPPSNAQVWQAQVQASVEKDNLSHYDSPQADMHGAVKGQRTVLRGHKRYWHQGPRVVQQLSAPPEAVRQSPKQYTRIRPVAGDKTFTFRIDFNNLSDAELGALCWALHPRGRQGHDYRHSLGMGKPLGMGAVKLAATLTRIDRKARYQGLFDADRTGWHTGITSTEDLSGTTVRDSLVKPFETCALAAFGVDGADAKLSDLRRIGSLLKLMEWPGQNPAQVRYESDLWVWRECRVLPPPSHFGGLGAVVPPTPPNDASQIQVWPPAGVDASTSPPESFGAPVNLQEHIDDARRQDARNLIAGVAEWSVQDLANELGGDRAPGNLALVQHQGMEREFIDAIAKHHGALLHSWASYGGKKGRAGKTFAAWQ